MKKTSSTHHIHRIIYNNHFYTFSPFVSAPYNTTSLINKFAATDLRGHRGSDTAAPCHQVDDDHHERVTTPPARYAGQTGVTLVVAALLFFLDVLLAAGVVGVGVVPLHRLLELGELDAVHGVGPTCPRSR